MVDRRRIAEDQAERALQRVSEQDKFVVEQVASASKWLTASLLAVNSAGLIAAVGSGLLEEEKFPALLFVLGAGAALCSGVAMQEFYNNISPVLRFKEAYWLRVRQRGSRSSALERRMVRRTSTPWSLAPPLFGWLSAILWLAGAVALLI